jgi:LysM domain
MSVMSAAEARQAAGVSPQLPSRRLRIATPAGDQDDVGPDGSPLGAEEVLQAVSVEGAGQESAAEEAASALRVTQVRVVREVSVRTLRAGSTRSATTSRPAAATRPATTTRTRTAASQTHTASQTHAASRVQRATHTRVTSQARVTTQVRQARPGPVRLTRRGRWVVAAFAILVVVVVATVLWMTVAGSVQASSHTPVGSPYRGMTQVVVRPGQTLWSIAAAAEPSGNPWAVVQQIMQVNALSGAQVQAGEQLWVPKA